MDPVSRQGREVNFNRGRSWIHRWGDKELIAKEIGSFDSPGMRVVSIVHRIRTERGKGREERSRREREGG
jgi:hypothetical protein